jgi:hypothetical protein
MAVLEKITISCFLENRGQSDELPRIREGGLGILEREQQYPKIADL